MIRLYSFAKINLGLEIVGKRADGYHNLKTLFQTIDFFDILEITENTLGKIRLSGDDPTIEWDERNTIYKAARLIYQNYPVRQGFDIHVRKNIPAGSGLGGGSSNAAVVLLFLKRYFALSISEAELIALAASIGADVPFFLYGGTVLAEGIGEKMMPQTDEFFRESFVDLVIPHVNVSTKLIFSKFLLTSDARNSKINIFINSKKENVLENDLEQVTCELFPEVGIIKEKMSVSATAYELVLMSGSGSSVFGLHRSRCCDLMSQKQELSRVFPGSSVVATRTLNRAQYLEWIGASPSGKASVFGADTRRFESSRPCFHP